MKNTLTQQEKVDEAVKLFRHFITDCIELDSLEQELDDLEFQYSRLLIEEEATGYVRRSDKLFLLHQLKCIAKLVDFNLMNPIPAA